MAANPSGSPWFIRPTVAKSINEAASPSTNIPVFTVGGRASLSPRSTDATPAQESSPRRSTRSNRIPFGTGGPFGNDLPGGGEVTTRPSVEGVEDALLLSASLVEVDGSETSPEVLLAEARIHMKDLDDPPYAFGPDAEWEINDEKGFAAGRPQRVRAVSMIYKFYIDSNVLCIFASRWVDDSNLL